MKKLNASIYSFEKLQNADCLYVDKTAYLWNLIQLDGGMYFLSRPRRFGKSLTLSTLKAIFQGKKELFQGLAIYDKPYDWKPYPVIHIDMNGRNLNTVEALENSLRNIIAEQALDLQIPLEMEDSAAMFQKLLKKAAVNSPVVVLVDEYDKPILNNITEPNAKEFLKVLKAFYSVIKARADIIRFAFITGVSKFCHVSLFSDLNNLQDLSLNADYAEMLGYTQTEFETNFAEWITATEKKQDLPHEEFLAEIKSWYDGYKFHAKAESVYNPVSLANFFINGGEFRNYWFETGTPTFLLNLIRQKRINLEQVLAEPVSAYTLSSFEIDDIPPVTLMLQTGYLTIKSAETISRRIRYRLDFPNHEVKESFNVWLLNAYAGKSREDMVNFCDRLFDAVVAGDLPKFQEVMEVFFAGISYDVHHKNEANFQNIFFCIFKLLGYHVQAESRTSDGRVDAIVETDKFLYFFEFKLNKDDSALAQIKEKEYFKPHLLSSKKIILVGANFNTKTGKLSNWKKEYL